MALSLPPQDHAAREMFSVSDLIAADGGMPEFPAFRAAKASAAEFLASEPMADRVCSIVRRMDGAVWLVSFGPKGGWRKEWNFGNPERAA